MKTFCQNLRIYIRRWCIYYLCKLSIKVAVAQAKLTRTVTPLALSHTQQYLYIQITNMYCTKTTHHLLSKI